MSGKNEVVARIFEQRAEIKRNAERLLRAEKYAEYKIEMRRWEGWLAANGHLLGGDMAPCTCQSTISEETWAEYDQNPTETSVMNAATKQGIE